MQAYLASAAMLTVTSMMDKEGQEVRQGWRPTNNHGIKFKSLLKDWIFN
jgi:hypothetical protein